MPVLPFDGWLEENGSTTGGSAPINPESGSTQERLEISVGRLVTV